VIYLVKIFNPKFPPYLPFILLYLFKFYFHTDLGKGRSECVRAYLSIHDCLSFLHKVMIAIIWTKQPKVNQSPQQFNLEYGSIFTKLFMHVSSRNMFPTTRNLKIRVHVYRPRHHNACVLTVCFLMTETYLFTHLLFFHGEMFSQIWM
jgi:hypothetical protein